MAKPTSSRNRSKRRASRRPTSSATRASRSASSTNSSRVTASGQTGITGARVTSSTRPSTPPTGTGPSSPQRTGQGGGRTIRGYVRHRNGYYYKPGKPNIFYKKEGNTFKPVSQGTLRIKPGQAQANTAVRPPTAPTKPPSGATMSNARILRDALNDQLSGRLMNTKGKTPTGGFRQGVAGVLAQALSENVINPLVDKATRNLIGRFRRATEDKAFPDAEGRLRRPDGSLMYAGPSVGDKYRKPPTNTGTVQEDVSQQEIQSRGGGDRGADAPRRMVTPNTPEAKKKGINQMYAEARKKALAIKDPTQRQAALEGVSQMGMELHREYFNKRPLTDL